MPADVHIREWRRRQYAAFYAKELGHHEQITVALDKSDGFGDRGQCVLKPSLNSETFH